MKHNFLNNLILNEELKKIRLLNNKIKKYIKFYFINIAAGNKRPFFPVNFFELYLSYLFLYF